MWKPRVSQVPIISERICTTSDPDLVSVSQDSLTGGRLILGSKSHINQMPPVYSVGRLVKHDNITFTSENHTWLIVSRWMKSELQFNFRDQGEWKSKCFSVEVQCSWQEMMEKKPRNKIHIYQLHISLIPVKLHKIWWNSNIQENAEWNKNNWDLSRRRGQRY